VLGRRLTRLVPAALAGLLAACVAAGITITRPPPPAPERPLPPRLEGESTPALVATESAGLLVAPSVKVPLFYYEPDELWYRFWRGRWYQAFGWNGAWFEPDRVPPPLRDGPPGEREPQPRTGGELSPPSP
jgi:hypothetical protein